jgi:Fe-S-cluster-containing dehydrogenase component/CRP-like cAMP-binding protein
MDPREPAPRVSDGPPASPGWPAVVFDAPVLRGLDARARREISDAGRILEPLEGAAVYRAGDEGASFFVVASGKIALRAVRRGDDRESELRAAGPGESFGEECTVGLGRRATAVALARSTVAEIPVHVFRRAAARSGKAEIAERLERSLQRTATADLLRTLAVTRDLGPREVDVLLDAMAIRRVERGQHVYRQGEPATELFLLADGLVQIQVEEADRLHVRAYLGRGDFFGDVEIDLGTMRAASAVAGGPAVLLAVPARVFRDLAAAHPDLVPRLRRLAEDQEAAQRAVVAPAAANATQHVFRDLYRLQVARSLLVIDLDSCVRCGHCAWACSSMYGVARLVRRGDKVVARVEPAATPSAARPAAAPQPLMLPNSCQHCENPACMVDCPTGAIGRDPGGEVFIREELCTGCGACAKACPWDNIQMSPRPADAPRPPGGPMEYLDVAVKCDLCREYEGPACVQACPTGSIFRLNPAEEIADVRAVLRGEARLGPAREGQQGASRARLVPGAALAAAGIGLAGAVMQARGLWQPARGVGLGAGVLAGLGMVLLLAYAVPKRSIHRWMRHRVKGAAPKRVESVVRPQLEAHLAIGLVTVGLALAHAPVLARGGAGAGTALAIAVLLTSIAGGFTAVAYRLVPSRLARLERTAALPEDFARARQELLDRLFREASGKSELVKKLLEKILLPYVESPLGPLALVASGRRLREEEDALRARVDVVLEGRGKERLAGLAELTRIVVELRALPAQRLLLRVLRVGLPLHVATFGIAMAMLALHVMFALGRR